MGYRNELIYPATGIHYCEANIASSIIYYILNQLPPGIIKEESIFLKGPSGESDYRMSDGESYNDIKKVSKPYVVCEITNPVTPGNGEEGDGPSIMNYSQFPGTSNDKLNKNKSYYYQNPDLDFSLSTIEFRKTISITMKFVASTIDDAKSLRSTFENRVPLLGIFENIQTSIILPNPMIRDMIRMLYGNVEFDNNLYDEFVKELNRNSNQTFEHRILDNDKNQSYIVMRRLYPYTQFKIDFLQDGDINKDGNIVTSAEFTVSCPQMGYTMPNSYILSFDTLNVINKGIYNDLYFNKITIDDKGNLLVDNNPSEYVDTRVYPLKPPDGFEKIHVESFMICDKVDYISIKDFLPDECEYKELMDWLTIKEREKLFDVKIYEGGYLVDLNVFAFRKDTGDDIIYDIIEGNVAKTYELWIYGNKGFIEGMKSLIRIRKESNWERK